jgi:hypothetical protein
MWPWIAKARPAPDGQADSGTAGASDAASGTSTKLLGPGATVHKLTDRLYCFVYGEAVPQAGLPAPKISNTVFDDTTVEDPLLSSRGV